MGVKVLATNPYWENPFYIKL